MTAQSTRMTTVFLYIFLVFASGCTPKTTVVLLPDPDGDIGHITVMTDVGSVDITRAGEASTISGANSLPSPPKLLTKNELDTNFSGVLATLPSQPVHFILYFRHSSTKLTAKSTETLPAIIESVRQRNSQDISVIGHSDTAGNPKYNLQLSTQRAIKVSRLLVQYGINQNHIKSTSHGEENLLIKTADNVSEPRNRRVEVVIK